MSDDDVEYIGTKNAPELLILDHPFPLSNRPLYAVVLHIERCNDKPAYGMWFRKSEFNVVNIGRRPGGVTAEKRFEYTMSGRAMFRCPVVSRRHAKIVFSDTQAYLIDLGSHHGTHVLKPGDTVSTMLKPETPTALANNDVVTFGKVVGRGDHVVNPVVVRIGLIYNPRDGDPPALPSLPDLLTEDMPVIKAPEPVKPVSKAGHYGVHVPCSLVSDESYPGSSNESDIEELDGPPPSSDPASKSKVTEISSSFAALIPPKGPFNSQPQPLVIDVDSCPHSPVHRPLSPSPLYDPYSPPRYSPRYSPCDDSPIYAPWRSWGVPFLERVSPTLPPLNSDLFGNNADSRSRSRSTSPMDLASSSPSPIPHQEDEPWPVSRSPSPFTFNPSPEHSAPDSVVESTAAQATDTAPKLTEVSSVENNAPESRHPSPHPAHCDSEHESADPTPAKVTTNMLSTLEEKVIVEIAALQSTIASMRGEVSKLQMHRRKYKTRFNANVLTVAEKLVDLDERITDANAICSSVSEQLDGAVPSDMRAAIEAMQARVSALVVEKATSDKAPENNDAAATLDELRAMMAEFKSLRQRAETEIAADLQAVKAACKRALADIASQLETPLNPSLKRKRSDDEGEGEDENVAVAAVCHASNGREASRRLTLRATPIPVRTNRPCAKRMRRMVSTVLHTATAMTLGAVATWSALAFS